MRKLALIALILALGALVLSPVIVAFDMDSLPGDIGFHWGRTLVTIPTLYSLCASAGLALLYMIVKR